MTEVESCGCRKQFYWRKDNTSYEEYEYLCPNHKDEFILKLYNERL